MRQNASGICRSMQSRLPVQWDRLNLPCIWICTDLVIVYSTYYTVVDTAWFYTLEPLYNAVNYNTSSDIMQSREIWIPNLVQWPQYIIQLHCKGVSGYGSQDSILRRFWFICEFRNQKLRFSKNVHLMSLLILLASCSSFFVHPVASILHSSASGLTTVVPPVSFCLCGK